MPVPTETDICTLRIGSAVAEAGDVSDVEADLERLTDSARPDTFSCP